MSTIEAGRQAILQLKNLKVRFKTRDGEVAAVEDLSLQVARGEILGLVGESGCGKSTTALSIMHLLPGQGRISDGEVLLEGKDITHFNERQMRAVRGATVAMIFQDALAALDPTMHIGKQIMEPLQQHREISTTKARREAVRLLELVGISSPEQRMKQYIHEFSGGMRQRVMIAIALSCNPRLLLADEPTTALDVTVQRQILNLILHLRTLLEAGIILITHDIGVVGEVCDNVVVMYAGRDVEHGPTRSVFTQPRHPYTRGLLGSRLGTITDRTKPLYAIPGLPPSLLKLPPGCPFAPRCPKATDMCQRQMPLMEEVSPQHSVACWHWREA
ncbi:MAG: ABC transporter ATP-binding protein [Ktedonobacteraceae bacterium]